MISAAPVMPALSTLTHKGMDIRYGIWGKALYSAAERPNKPILVVLPGLSQFIEKYALIMLPLLGLYKSPLLLVNYLHIAN